MSACRRVGVAAGAALACLLLAARSRPRRRARASALRRLLEPKAPPTEPHKCVTEWDWRRDVNPHYTSYRLTDDDFNVTAPSDCDAPTAVVCEVRRFNVKQKVRNEWQHQQQALLPSGQETKIFDTTSIFMYPTPWISALAESNRRRPADKSTFGST